MKKLLLLFGIGISTVSCGELHQVAQATLPTILEGMTNSEGGVSTLDIGNGLREALDKGISLQVNNLAQKNGFYNNSEVKILLPQELQKVDKTLRDIGLGKTADKGLLLLNTAAEDAVKEAIPIFATAVKNISFEDARQILMGNTKAATTYLQNKTQTDLVAKFSPVIQNSLSKVGATAIWKELITKYNTIPLVFNKVNPDLTQYVTDQALKGVYTMIAKEEGNIRQKVNSRTSTLLQKVFALQDQ